MGAILVIASGEDSHARAVLRCLRARNSEATMLDRDRLGTSIFLCHRVGGDAPHLLIEGRRVSAEDVRAIWFRRPVPTQVRVTGMSHADREFAAREWRESLHCFLSTPALYVNDPTAQEAATKLRQLEVAASVGLRVPDTLVTNDKADAQGFVEAHRGRIVHKVLTYAEGELVETRVWDADAEASLDRLVFAPCMFQELIEGRAEVRATVVGQRVLAARFEPRLGAEQVDGRLDVDAPCKVCELPVAVEECVHALMQRLGLTFGAIDFKLDKDGEHVFLEVNPQGQFLYVEILTGLPIAAAVADLLEGAVALPRRSTTRCTAGASSPPTS